MPKAQLGNLIISRLKTAWTSLASISIAAPENAGAAATTAASSGRRARPAATENQKANASAKKDKLDDALVRSEPLDQPPPAQVRPDRRLDGNERGKCSGSVGDERPRDQRGGGARQLRRRSGQVVGGAPNGHQSGACLRRATVGDVGCSKGGSREAVVNTGHCRRVASATGMCSVATGFRISPCWSKTKCCTSAARRYWRGRNEPSQKRFCRS